MKTLYVTDLDGTLLNTQDTISPFSLETINDLVDQGMVFTFATARSLVSASAVTKGLSANIPLICYNGCLIIHPLTNKVLHSVSFTSNRTRKAKNIILQNDVSPLVYSYINGVEKVSWITEKENEGIKRYLSLRDGDKRFNPLNSEDKLFDGDVFYFTCIGEKEELLPIYNTLKEDSDYTCTLQQELYREEYWCEIMPKEATKANAIRTLKEIWQCDKVVSFGDAINDIPMFKESDECYAVENAVPELKKYATEVIACNNEDGVAKWLTENVKKKPSASI